MAKEQEEDQKAINFGLALHYCLEMMQDFTDKSAEKAYSAMLNRYGNILDSDELQNLQRRVAMLLESEQFLRLTEGECFKEKGMLVKGELRFMDLLVKRDDGGYNIIDYKSSEHFSDYHVKQVQGYKNAVKKITSAETNAYLCYLKENAIVIKEVL